MTTTQTTAPQYRYGFQSTHGGQFVTLTDNQTHRAVFLQGDDAAAVLRAIEDADAARLESYAGVIAPYFD
jgi:hypothetical protein